MAMRDKLFDIAGARGRADRERMKQEVSWQAGATGILGGNCMGAAALQSTVHWVCGSFAGRTCTGACNVNVAAALQAGWE